LRHRQLRLRRSRRGDSDKTNRVIYVAKGSCDKMGGTTEPPKM
jgi:hypothetical protein